MKRWLLLAATTWMTNASAQGFRVGRHFVMPLAPAGAGTDSVMSSVTYTLYGNSASNTLNGGAGADVLIGGAGDDLYIVDNTGDIVTELAGEGVDTVQSAVSYTLSANVENLILTGTGANKGTGNDLDNVLTGNSGNNTLDGGAGNDVLDGGSQESTGSGLLMKHNIGYTASMARDGYDNNGNKNS